MRTTKNRSLLQKIYRNRPSLMKRPKVEELVRVYRDLEKTLKWLKENPVAQARSNAALGSINIRKLIRKLSASKRRIETKIGNTLLLEKQHLKKRLRAITSLSRSTKVFESLRRSE